MGAPRRYKKDEMKILKATCHMDRACLRRWTYHLKEKTPEDRKAAENN